MPTKVSRGRLLGYLYGYKRVEQKPNGTIEVRFIEGTSSTDPSPELQHERDFWCMPIREGDHTLLSVDCEALRAEIDAAAEYLGEPSIHDAVERLLPYVTVQADLGELKHHYPAAWIMAALPQLVRRYATNALLELGYDPETVEDLLEAMRKRYREELEEL